MIKILKLITGEELIGDITLSDAYHIKQPCVLQLVPSRSDPAQVSMVIIPYAGYTKDHSISVEKRFVVWCEEPMQEVYNQYNSAFGSGIVVAKSPLIN